MNKDYNYLFKTKRFLPLFITQFCSAFNDNVLKNALVILVTYKLSETLPMPAGFIILIANALFILPYIVFAGIAGQICDKYENTIIIKIVKFIEILIATTAIYAFLNENIILLLLLIFFMGTHSAFFGPVKYSILPDHLKRDELLSANGYIEAATFLSILLGTLIGGLYVGYSYFVIFIMLLISIVGFISSLYIPKSTNFNKNLVINRNIFKEIIVIMKYAQSRRNVFLSILGISWFWFLGATLLSQIPLLAKEVLYADYGVSNLFLATFSLGVVTGSFLCNKIISNEITAKYLFVSAIGISIFGIDLYFACKSCTNACEATSLSSVWTFVSNIKSWRIIIDLFFMSSVTGIYAVPLYAVMQYYSPVGHRSRIIAANNVYNAIFMIISFIFIYTLFKLHFAVPTIILLLSIVNIGVAIFILSFTPEVRLIPDPVIQWFAKTMCDWLYKVEVRGLENYYNAGDRVVIIANHNSYLDSALLSVYLPEKPIFAIDTSVAKKWWVKIFLNYTKTHNIDNLNAMGIKPLISSVRRGKKIAIFPEGRLSITGSLMKVYEGPGMIADKADAMILPIMINGTQYTHFSRLNNLPKRKIFTKIVINILPPIKLTAPSDYSIRERRKYIAESLYQVMSGMVFESSTYDQTIYQSLIDIAKIVGLKKPIYTDIDNTILNFRNLFKENFILSNYLTKLSKNDVIGLLLPNYNISLSVFFAVQSVGKIPLLINSELDSKDIIEHCQNSKVNLIVSSKRYLETDSMKDLHKVLEDNFHILYLEDIAKNLNLGAIIKANILSYFPQTTYNKICIKQNPKSICALVSETDSYGRAKLVAFSHENILANIAQVKSRIDFKADDVAFNALPIYNSFGLSSTLMMTLSGIKTFLYNNPNHYRIITEMIYMSDSTIIFSTNTLLNNYARFAHPYDFSSVRYVISFGEKLARYTNQIWMEKYGIKIYESYGLTEASSFIALNTPMHNKSGTHGRFLPHIEYKIQDIENIKDGGKLLIKGPNIALGYINKGFKVKKLLNQTIEHGWFDTNYIAKLDSENYVTIFGSLSNYYIINNEYISLDLIKNIAMQIDEESEHIAVFSEEKQCVVLFTTSNIINSDSYTKYLQDKQYSENSIPAIFHKLATIPLTDSGNYNYKYLKSLIKEL